MGSRDIGSEEEAGRPGELKTYLLVLLDLVGKGLLEDSNLVTQRENFVEACLTLAEEVFLRGR